MIEAAIGINDYIKQQLSNNALTFGTLYPGTHAPTSENSDKFTIYELTQGDTFDLFGLRSDDITYTMFNTSYTDQQRIVTKILQTFNVENIQNTTLSASGIQYRETIARVTGKGEASFVEGTTYYLTSISVSYKYTSA